MVSKLRPDGVVLHYDDSKHHESEYHRCSLCLFLGWHPSGSAQPVCDPDDFTEKCKWCIKPSATPD